MIAERYSVAVAAPITGDPMPPYINGLLMSALFLLPSSAFAADTVAPKHLEWDYMGGGNNDEDWGLVSPESIICTTGHQQSPVGLNYTTISTMPPMETHYRKSKIHMQKADYTLVLDVDGNNTLSDQTHAYKLTQIRMHSPSEHTVKSRMYPLELQLIHKDDKGHLLITAIFVQEEGETPHPVLQSIIDLAPPKRNNIVNLSFDPAELLPKKNGYFSYQGSITWPPCTEGVEWRVYKWPINMTKDQLRKIAVILRRNARTLQPIYLRTIKETMY